MFQNVINKIREDLTKTFAGVDEWFNSNDRLLDYSPKNGGWTIRQILEHIALTNCFLLILIRKGTAKALRIVKKNGYANLPTMYDLDWNRLRAIGEHQSFEWNRPEHMEPTGELSLESIKAWMNKQVEECLHCLDQMPNGEGALYKTMMTVNNLGKIDVYHYIYFLVQHAKRHIIQMEKTKAEAEYQMT